jgi:uncharacterized membrane protein YjjP (DUF1212 family)
VNLEEAAAGRVAHPNEPPEHEFLLRVAELLHAYGTPAHRLERVLVKVAARLGVRASFLSTPTSVFASLGAAEDEHIHLMRVEPGEIDLGKLVEFDEVMEDVEVRRVPVGEATARLDAIAGAPSRYGALARILAFGVASAGAARFFQGGLREVVVSLVVGAGIGLLDLMFTRRPLQVGVFEPLAAFLAAIVSLLAASVWGGLDHRIATLASLIVLLPGLSLTVAMTELATRHLVSGTARFAGALVSFLTILLGVALAWRVGGSIIGGLPAATTIAPPSDLPGWTLWLGVALTPLAFAILFEARPRELLVIWLTSVAGFAAATFGARSFDVQVGPFLGALVVGILSNLYARVADRPALVPSTPGVLLLVPGSLGFLSLTSLLNDETLVGIEGAFRTGLVAVSLAGGLLAANVVLPPRRVL